MNAVVQINAQESDKLVRQNEERNNPFKDHPLFREFNFPGFGGYMPKKEVVVELFILQMGIS